MIPLNPLTGVETKRPVGLPLACLQRLHSFALLALFPAFPHVGKRVFRHTEVASFSFFLCGNARSMLYEGELGNECCLRIHS